MKNRLKHWTHPSVLKLTGDDNPIDIIVKKARSIVINAIQEGWVGPPFDPFKLAELMRIDTIPNSEVFDAHILLGAKNRFVVEYNPNKARSRIRFSLAHELAHTLFPDCSDNIRKRQQADEMREDDWQLELLCNIASAEFLMPVGTGRNLETEPVNINNIIRLQNEYEVSTEAVSIRMVKLTAEPCTMFAASRVSDNFGSGFRIDYCVPSRSSSLDILRNYYVKDKTILGECTAIGFTATDCEHWESLPKMDLECIGIPPYPSHSWPRVIGIARAPANKISKGFHLKFLHGNVLEPRGEGPKIIAHIVNDKTPNWGAGFPIALKKKWPESQEDFSNWIQEDRRKLSLGSIHITKIKDDIDVVHMIAQHGYGPSIKPRIRYSALDDCLNKLAKYALNKSATVHMPRIGTGQAGGNWAIIADLIDESLVRNNIEVIVYILPKTSPVNHEQGLLDFPSKNLGPN